MLKTMGIEIMYTNFHIDWTNILGVLVKKLWVLFFLTTLYNYIHFMVMMTTIDPVHLVFIHKSQVMPRT